MTLELPAAVEAADLRLVLVDMDGTLLGGDGRIDPGFWALAERLVADGVVLGAGSGRPYVTLVEQFGPFSEHMLFIAENGAHVVLDGATISTAVMESDVVARAVGIVRDVASSGARTGTVLCGTSSAYAEFQDPDFLQEARRYYTRLEIVDDLLGVTSEVVKVAVHDSGPVADSAFPALQVLSGSHTVVLSGEHWTDVTNLGVTKGTALQHVQGLLGITPAQTVAFGDHLNDLEMLDAAGMSYAMENAHPQVRSRARFTAPANTSNGVGRVLEAMLDLAHG